MKIEAKELSKIYGVGENRVVALDKVIRKWQKHPASSLIRARQTDFRQPDL